MYEKREEWIYYKKPWAINGKYEKKNQENTVSKSWTISSINETLI